MKADPTQRFSDRVSSYVSARPTYPSAVVEEIQAMTGLAGPSMVADVGSGTGIFSRLLLGRGYTVHGVEPNEPMRRSAQEAFASEPRFRSVDGRAESTTLPGRSVDLVTAAQAFHWFDPERARVEWRRILRPPGWVAVVTNIRRSEGSPFAEAFESFLQEWGRTAYAEVSATWKLREPLTRLFAGKAWVERSIPNAQVLNAEGLANRVLSSSYLPGPGDLRTPAMLDAVQELFDTHEVDGAVTIEYATEVHVGSLTSQAR
jgi:SAM-dependent methyltransferase